MRSPIQPKKQDNRISSGGGCWRQQGRVGKKFDKTGIGNIGVLYKIGGGGRTPPVTMHLAYLRRCNYIYELAIEMKNEPFPEAVA